MSSSSFLKVAYLKPGRGFYEGDVLLGRWYCMTYRYTIEIFKSEEGYNGKVILSDKLEDKPGWSVTNLYPEKGETFFSGNRNSIELPYISGLVYNAKSRRWEGGRIIDYSSGKTKFVKAWISGNNSLTIRRYWNFMILRKDISFIRAKQ